MKITKTEKNNQPERQSITIERIITNKVPVIGIEAAVSEVERILFDKIKEFETINYIYVVNKDNKLKGVISVKDVFRISKSRPVADVMIKNVVSARIHTDRERVARLAIRHNLKAIPIIDKEDHFLGVVPSDEILNILHNKNIEDALRFAGISKLKESEVGLIEANSIVHFKKRFPWLAVGLLGGIVAAFIVDRFEAALRANLILAAFIPTIVYLSDALGTQTETIFIRSLALDERINMRKYLWREIRVSFMLAVSLATVVFLISFFWQQDLFLGIILWLSVFFASIGAMALALIFPWLLFKFRKDPAFAAGPFATILSDILSILVYFSIAQIMLNFFY